MGILIIIIAAVIAIFVLANFLAKQKAKKAFKDEMKSYREFLRRNVPKLDNDIKILIVSTKISELKTLDDKKKWILKHYQPALSTEFKAHLQPHGATMLSIINGIIRIEIENMQYCSSPEEMEKLMGNAVIMADAARFPEVVKFGYFFAQTLSVILESSDPADQDELTEWINIECHKELQAEGSIGWILETVAHFIAELNKISAR